MKDRIERISADPNIVGRVDARRADIHFCFSDREVENFPLSSIMLLTNRLDGGSGVSIQVSINKAIRVRGINPARDQRG